MVLLKQSWSSSDCVQSCVAGAILEGPDPNSLKPYAVMVSLHQGQNLIVSDESSSECAAPEHFVSLIEWLD